MSNIAIPTPPSLAAFREALREFIAGMLRKLDRNSHKGTPTTADIPTIMNLLMGEVEEFREEYAKNPKGEDALIELFDVANFAFLAYTAMRLDGAATAREALINTFLRVDCKLGKVYCAKTRAGSQYKMGEEIRGTPRNGYIDIRLQSKSTDGSGTVVPRSHLVWWKAKGKWPIGIIDHRNRKRDDDRIKNLRDIGFSKNAANHGKIRKLPPFVTQYVPSGRQHLVHYGKYVYQRHWRGINIRCAYYNTPQEAASKGARAWHRETKKREDDSDV